MSGEQRPCGYCGELVYIPKNRLDRGTMFFCSNEHQAAWQGRNKTDHVCKICSKAFRWSPSRSKQGNVLYCSLACRDADPERLAMLVELNARQQRGMPTKPEQIGYSILDGLDIAYLPQHVIAGKFCVDAFVPSCGLVIQFDGDYWHGNPARFPAPDARQQKRMRLDASQDAYMRACGYTVCRIWASDLENRAEHVTDQLRMRLAQLEPNPAVLG